MNDELTELLNIVNDKQDLHPDLRPYVSQPDGVPMQMIQHPLLHTFYTPGFESMMNATYEQKRSALADMENRGDWGTIVTTLIEKPHRLHALMRYADRMDDKLYWQCVTEIWTSMEYFQDWLDDWALVFDADRPGKHHMMTDEELAHLSGLPDKVEIYRAGSEDGWSWTTHMDVAEWFSRRHGLGTPIHIETVLKSEIEAFLDRRNEFEIIWRGNWG